MISRRCHAQNATHMGWITRHVPHTVAYLVAADNVSSPLPFCLHRVHQSVVLFQKWRWPHLHCPSKGIPVHKQANELVASFQESRCCAPWPWGRARVADEGGAIRKMRGTPW